MIAEVMTPRLSFRSYHNSKQQIVRANTNPSGRVKVISPKVTPNQNQRL